MGSCLPDQVCRTGTEVPIVRRRLHLFIRLVLPLQILVLSIPGCTPRVDSPNHDFTVRREDNVTVVLTTGGPKFTEELFRYEKALELKEDPEQPESLLYRPNGLVMDSDGNVFVNDAGSGQVVMYDQNGDYLRRIGRQGEGPGEFRQLEILDISEGVISVYDVALNRATRFRTDGAMIDVTMIPFEARSNFGSNLVTAMHQENDGKKILIQYIMDMGIGTYQYRVTVLESESDTLWSVVTENIKSLYIASMPTGTGGMISQIIYGPLPAICYQPEVGIVVSDGDKPELSLYATDGTLQRRIRIDLEPDPVTSDERARIMGRYDQRIADAEGSLRDMRKAQKDAAVIAEEKPCWTDVRIDDSGFFWLLISETQQERSENGGNLFRVLSPEGEYLGNSRWPTSLSHARLSHGHLLYVVGNEETGESVPTAFRIIPVVSGLKYPYVK